MPPLLLKTAARARIGGGDNKKNDAQGDIDKVEHSSPPQPRGVFLFRRDLISWTRLFPTVNTKAKRPNAKIGSGMTQLHGLHHRSVRACRRGDRSDTMEGGGKRHKEAIRIFREKVSTTEKQGATAKDQ